MGVVSMAVVRWVAREVLYLVGVEDGVDEGVRGGESAWSVIRDGGGIRAMTTSDEDRHLRGALGVEPRCVPPELGVVFTGFFAR